MRRDLAVYRAQRGTTRSDQAVQTAAAPQHVHSKAATVGHQDADIIMGDSSAEDQNAPSPQQTTTASNAEQQAKPKSPLYLDIPGQDHQAAGHPTDEITGTHSNFDFESLFNDPGSSVEATACGTPKDVTPQPPQSQSQPSQLPEAEKPASTLR